jgi:hypothetical protein
MFRRTVQITWNRTALEAFLANINTDAQALSALDGLFASFYTDGPAGGGLDVAIGDYTVAALTAGVVLDAITVGPNLPGGPSLHQEIEVLAGPAPTDESLLGVLIRKAVGGPLWGVATFIDPVGIAVEGDGVSLDVILAMPSEWPTGVAE